MTSAADNPSFGRYILVSKLGMGGMAEVFKAQIRNNPDVVVAIKRILPQFTQDKKLVSMLVNEARLSMSLNHQNIVPVLDFGMVDGDYFIAMEYIKGKDLKSIMIRCKTRKTDLPVHMSIYIVSQVLRALDFAHHKRDNYDQPLHIVHRDVSPHNILISLWGEVKILDFGIAKAATLAGSTQTGILKGKFSYMSPEQSHGEDVDHRTDLFSAGIVLWELLTLESYYQADSDVKLLSMVRDAKFRSPDPINPKVAKPLVEILQIALEKKPRKRFQTASEFLQALENYQRDTFGTVTEQDLAAFVRSLFGISAEEILSQPRPSRPSPSSLDLASSVTGSNERPMFPGYRGVRSFWRGLEIPDWIWKTPLAAALVTFLAWGVVHYPPKFLFQKYDRFALKLAEKVHVSISPPKTQPMFNIDPPVIPRPTYKLILTAEAKSVLADLAFDVFDRIRSQIEDLSFDPRPAQSDAVPDRPGFRAITQAGYKIVYSFSDQPKVVTVSTIYRKR